MDDPRDHRFNHMILRELMQFWFARRELSFLQLLEQTKTKLEENGITDESSAEEVFEKLREVFYQ